MIVRGGCCAALLAAAMPATAQDGWRVSGSARVRGEAIDNQPRAGAPRSDAAVFTRLRVAVEHVDGPLTLGGELIDSRVLFEGDASAVADTEINALEPSQLWAGLEVLPDTQLKIGRFFLNLGSRRLVAENAFRNTINSFTGARLDAKHGRTVLTAFWTMPQDRLPDDPAGLRAERVRLDRERTAQQLFGGIARSTIGNFHAEAYVYRLWERDDERFATRNRRLWTPGARVRLEAEKTGADAEIEVAAQFGTARLGAAAADTDDRRVRAWLVHAGAGYAWAGAWRPRLAVAFDYASGDRPGGAYTRFDTLFGARSFEFGPTGLLGAIGRANLVSAELRGEVRPDDRLDGWLAVRPLWLDSATDAFGATAVRDAAGQSGRHAGTQVEARVRYALVPDRLRLSAGAAWLAKGRQLRDAPNAPAGGDTRYGYLELNWTP